MQMRISAAHGRHRDYSVQPQRQKYVRVYSTTNEASIMEWWETEKLACFVLPFITSWLSPSFAFYPAAPVPAEATEQQQQRLVGDGGIGEGGNCK